MRDFPHPVYFTTASPRWALSKLEEFENSAHGSNHPRRASADEIYLTKTQVARRYGVGRRTIERWTAVSEIEVAA